MSVKFNTAVTGVLLATSVAVSAAVLPALDAASVADFEDYKPPVRLDVIKYDYMTSTGSPSATPTSFPTWQLKFPYRAFLLGARPTSNNGTQKHDCVIYVVYSKTPTLDFFSFTYMPGTKSSTQSGYIRADYTDGWDTMGRDKDWLIMSVSRTGVTPGNETVPLYSLANYPSVTGRKYFDFDFYYQCCGTLSINGLRNVTDVPYPYILTCADLNGNGGGSQAGSSSTGSGGSGDDSSSSGGSSSGGGSSGGGDSSSGDGSSSGSSGDSSSGGGGWESGYEFPSESGSQGGATGDTGERGDGWTLPEWGDDDFTGEAGGFQELQPGTSDWGYEEMKPGTDEWGYEEMKPGTSDWGLQTWTPWGSQGLIDFMARSKVYPGKRGGA